MAKRFTDTEKWKKPFLRSLQGAYKLLWFYICDDCDHAGIWQVDMDVAKIRTGEKSLNEEKAIKSLNEKIVVFDSGKKWFIPSFIEFQYPKGLNPTNKAHGSVIHILSKYNLINEDYKPLPSPLQGAKDKDMVKDMELDMDKEPKPEKQINIPFAHFWEQYDKKVGEKGKLEKKWATLSDQDRCDIIKYLPGYILSKPEKKFRKDPSTFLNNQSWKDEIINDGANSGNMLPSTPLDIQTMFNLFKLKILNAKDIQEEHYKILCDKGMIPDSLIEFAIKKRAGQLAGSNKGEEIRLMAAYNEGKQTVETKIDKSNLRILCVLEVFIHLRSIGQEAVFHAQN